VKFNRAGTHYMHIRGYGSDYNNDACHGGINFQGPPALASMAFTPPLAYVWDTHGGSEIVIPYPGIHKIHVYMREDGTIIDKIVITDTPGVPSEDGPPESERGGENVGGQTGFSDDPDGDGIANGLENFFGTDPNAFSTGLTAVGVLSTGGSNTFTLTHPQNATPPDDISGPAYSWSTDLQTFTADGASEGGTMVSFEAVVNNPEDGTTTVTATITGTIPDRLFVRLGVTQIAP
jgi:hypothetical protein